MARPGASCQWVGVPFYDATHGINWRRSLRPFCQWVGVPFYDTTSRLS